MRLQDLVALAMLLLITSAGRRAAPKKRFEE
jgi:hypothetical protein